VAHGLDGALDPARRSVVTEIIVRAGGGIVWRRGEGGAVEWEMTPTAGTLGPANEIDDARWVPLQQAPMLLTYEHDRRLLEGWLPAE
jgi:hypothetical protein